MVGWLGIQGGVPVWRVSLSLSAVRELLVASCHGKTELRLLLAVVVSIFRTFASFEEVLVQ